MLWLISLFAAWAFASLGKRLNAANQRSPYLCLGRHSLFNNSLFGSLCLF